MKTVSLSIRKNGGFSFAPPFPFFAFLILFLFTFSAGGQEKKNNDFSSLLQIRTTGKNVRNGVVKEIKEVKFDPTGITRFTGTSAPPAKKYMSKTQLHRNKRFTKIPSSSLAALLQEKATKETIRWKPRIMPGKGLALQDSILSRDRSLWIFLETHGNSPGPYATRLIFLNTHTWKIVFAKDYPQFYALKGVIIGEKLLLYCKGQESRDTRDAIVFIDIASGEVLNSVTVPFPVGRMITGKNLLAITEKEAPTIRLYALKEEELVLQKEWKCASINPALAFSADGKRLLAAGKNVLEELRLSDMRLWKKHTLNLPFPPAKIFLPGYELLLFLPGNDSTGNDARLLRNGVITSIGSVSGGLALPGLEKNHFLLLMARKGAFVDYVLPGCEEGRAISGVELRPRTRGSVHFAETIPHAGSIAIMDSNGVFYLLFPDYAGKRFQKMILIQ